MRASRRPLAGVVTLLALTGSLGLSACSPEKDAENAAGGTSAPAPGGCAATPVNVAVSVDQWGDIVSELGGECAKVTTVLASSSVDPHEFEPAPADAATFANAQLVVVNGANYDPWASKLAATSAPEAPVVDAAEVTKAAEGANPHLWYSPSAVTAVADAVTAELSTLSPEVKSYFAERRSAFTASMEPYNTLLDAIRARASGRPYAATENVFDYTANDIGLVNMTPPGYQRASANKSDASPADVEAFQRALAEHQIDVLIYNTQTQGSVPEEIRSAADAAGVPVVEATETVPPWATSFEQWQVAQLKALAKALGVAG
ncbi:MAG: zinc ABC transporter substrate-binding protein [Actinomycetia bacterium]|nr:zinc ABC transporter substrate-binding protein [Actinomycetes bacterium]